MKTGYMRFRGVISVRRVCQPLRVLLKMPPCSMCLFWTIFLHSALMFVMKCSETAKEPIIAKPPQNLMRESKVNYLA